MSKSALFRLDVAGWTLYDFANTIYSMNIVSLYLKRYIVEDMGKPDYFFDIPFSLSMILAAILLPALGAMSDHSTKKKLFVMLFTLTCCSAVGLMQFVPPSLLFLVLGLFVIANFSYEAAQPFYNSLLYSVADGKEARFVSGMGVSLGYVGSIVGMLLVLPFVNGELFGLELPEFAGGSKLSAFLPTALLFFVFTIPLMRWVKERKVTTESSTGFLPAYREVFESLKETRRYPGVRRFLIADFFVEDAAMTVILNIGLYCSLVIGFSDLDITRFLIVSTVAAVVGSFFFGWLAKHFSLKPILMSIIIGWIVTLTAFVFVDSRSIIWVLGSVVGVMLGGLWTTTRPYLAEMVPRDELGRFFGLFSLSGRAAAFGGPLLWTLVVYLFRSDSALSNSLTSMFALSSESAVRLQYKAGVLSLALMMLIGLIIFLKVPEPEGKG